MHPARACSLALAASLGAAPTLARAQGPIPSPAVPLPTSSSAPAAPAPTTPVPLGPAPPPSSTPAPPDVSPVPVAPAPIAPAPAPIAPIAPAPIAPVTPAPEPVASQPYGDSVVPVEAGRTEVIPPLPRLSLTVGGVFGPHAHGEAACQTIKEAYQCEYTGNFLGLGGTIELRAQIYRFLFVHARGLVVGNLRKQGVHRGLGGGGLGLGAYSRFAFIRGEYMLVPTLGPNTYRPPFYDQPVARDVYGLHAGMFSAGVRKYISPRASLEAWGGLVIGPRSERTTLAADANEERLLLSFMFSLGFTYDLIPAKGYTPQPLKPRPRRQWGTR
jgi:hypothetical protein